MKYLWIFGFGILFIALDIAGIVIGFSLYYEHNNYNLLDNPLIEGLLALTINPIFIFVCFILGCIFGHLITRKRNSDYEGSTPEIVGKPWLAIGIILSVISILVSNLYIVSLYKKGLLTSIMRSDFLIIDIIVVILCIPFIIASLDQYRRNIRQITKTRVLLVIFCVVGAYIANTVLEKILFPPKYDQEITIMKCNDAGDRTEQASCFDIICREDNREDSITKDICVRYWASRYQNTEACSLIASEVEYCRCYYQFRETSLRKSSEEKYGTAKYSGPREDNSYFYANRERIREGLKKFQQENDCSIYSGRDEATCKAIKEGKEEYCLNLKN